MSRIVICSGISWAALQQASPSWLPGGPAPNLILVPSLWNTQKLPTAFPNSLVLTTVEFLECYLDGQLKQKHLLSKAAVTHLLNAIIYETAGEEKTVSARFLNIETSYPGYVRALTEFIIDFRENGGESLLAALSAFKAGPLSAKERDLIDIHDELERALHERNLYDYRRALLSFVEDEKTGQPQAFLPDHAESNLVVFGFNHLTGLEATLLRCLAHRFEHTIFAVCKNGAAAEATFKAQIPLQNFLAQVQQEFAGDIAEIEIDRGADTVPLQLAEALFHDDKTGRLLQSAPDVQIISANSRFIEVTNLARQMRQLHAFGVPYERMRVIFPNYEIYAALLLEIFPSYGIPYHLTAGTPPAFYPLAQLVLNLINHAVTPSPFALRELIFSSPYVTYSCDVNAEALLEYVNKIEENLLGSEDAVSMLPEPREFALNFADLQMLRKRAAQAVRTAEKFHPLQLIARYLQLRYPDDRQEQQREIFKAAVNYYVLSQAEKALYVWRSNMEPAAFCHAIESLLRRFHVEKNASALTLSKDESTIAVIERDKSVLAHLRQLFAKLQQQFSALAAPPERKFALADLVQAFSGLLRDPENYIPDSRSEGVAICTLAEAPLQFWDATFIAGLIDGDFPAQEPFNFLQPKSEGRALTGELAFVDRDRQALYQILASTTRRLFVSHPVSDNGKKLLVSPFVTEMQKCFSGELALETVGQDALYTMREKLVEVGQHVDRSYERALPVLRELKQNSADFFEQIIAIMQCDGLRGSISNFSHYDGLINRTNALATLKEQIGDEFVFNVEQLERFAGCSLRFLFDDLVHLKPEYLTDYHPDNTERGVLVRRILTEYTRAAASAGRAPKNAAKILHEATVAALGQMLNEKDNLFSQKFRNGLLMGLQDDKAEARKRPGLLAAFLKYEKTAPDLLAPYLADLVFKRGEANGFRMQDIPIDIEIERVDVTSNGEFMVIFNYSTSDHGDVEKIGKGLRFKLPLQILALRQHLASEDKNKTVAGAGVYLVKSHRNIKRGGYFALKDLQASREDKVNDATPIFSGQRKYGFLPAANFEQELQTVQQRITHIVNLIHRGRFHLPICSVKDQICPNCHFSRICRKEQLRLDKLYSQVDEKETYKPLRRVE
ncbi:PD-(D/E)XK nuclease family protein [candidate division KSB1 bacterium]|nr:PD-(D/E)XK nuclease family protein [candidate division KSB1 bacterium]